MQILMILLLLGLVILALAITFTKRLLPAVIIFMSYSLVTSIIWMLLQSPDLAITEAAVGAGVSTVMFIIAFRRMGLFEKAMDEESKIEKKEPLPVIKHKKFNKFYDVLCIAFTLVFMLAMLITVFALPSIGDVNNPTNNEVSEKYIADSSWETGSLNAVSGMILDYRAFDTLGESHVLFVATIAVFIMLRRDEDSPKDLPTRYLDTSREPAKDPIISKTLEFVIPAIFLFGIYVIANGHLSPGGGFSGGAIIGAGMILYLNAYGLDRVEKLINSKSYLICSCSALLFYGLAKSYVFYVGANHLTSIIPVFADGSLFASGLILPLNIAVGIVVSNTIYALYIMFRRGGFRR